MKVLFAVHTSSKRRYSRVATLQSIHRSDIEDFIVLEQPPNASPQKFFAELLRHLSTQPHDIVVRLEDDIELNTNIAHNIKSWRALREPDFGVGFLSNAANYCPPFEVTATGSYRSLRPEVSAALGQVFLTSSLRQLLPALERHPDHLRAITRGSINFDHLVSKACFDQQLSAYVHFPALVRETTFGRIHSAWGNVGPDRHPNQPDFSIDWKSSRNIPKVLHQIWIGSSPMPTQLMNSWREKNPDWEYKLWTKESGWENQELIDSIPEMHGKADIIRYELLWREGGVYIDADSECITSLDDFLLDPPVWASWECYATRPGIVSNGYLGAQPNHVLYAALLDRCRTLRHFKPIWRTVGTGLVSDEARYHPDLHLWPSTMWCPRHFTGATDAIPTPIFARQFWGSTLGYGSLLSRAKEQEESHSELQRLVSQNRVRRYASNERGLPPFYSFGKGSAFSRI